jgi:hypothetical protein
MVSLFNPRLTMRNKKELAYSFLSPVISNSVKEQHEGVCGILLNVCPLEPVFTDRENAQFQGKRSAKAEFTQT